MGITIRTKPLVDYCCHIGWQWDRMEASVQFNRIECSFGQSWRCTASIIHFSLLWTLSIIRFVVFPIVTMVRVLDERPLSIVSKVKWKPWRKNSKSLHTYDSMLRCNRTNNNRFRTKHTQTHQMFNSTTSNSTKYENVQKAPFDMLSPTYWILCLGLAKLFSLSLFQCFSRQSREKSTANCWPH